MRNTESKSNILPGTDEYLGKEWKRRTMPATPLRAKKEQKSIQDLPLFAPPLREQQGDLWT